MVPGLSIVPSFVLIYCGLTRADLSKAEFRYLSCQRMVANDRPILEQLKNEAILNVRCPGAATGTPKQGG